MRRSLAVVWGTMVLCCSGVSLAYDGETLCRGVDPHFNGICQVLGEKYNSMIARQPNTADVLRIDQFVESDVSLEELSCSNGAEKSAVSVTALMTTGDVETAVFLVCDSSANWGPLTIERRISSTVVEQAQRVIRPTRQIVEEVSLNVSNVMQACPATHSRNVQLCLDDPSYSIEYVRVIRGSRTSSRSDLTYTVNAAQPHCIDVAYTMAGRGLRNPSWPFSDCSETPKIEMTLEILGVVY